jgi:hypothetical protein
MSKNELSVPQSVPMDGRAIYDYQIQSLEGKLLGFIESLGLPGKQEVACKELFKDIFYRTMYFETTYVYGEFLNPAIEKTRELNGDSNGRVGSSSK